MALESTRSTHKLRLNVPPPRAGRNAILMRGIWGYNGATVAWYWNRDGLVRVRTIPLALVGAAFVSASARHVDRLVAGGYVVPGTRRDLLRNTLVCVVKAPSPLRPAAPGDLTGAALERIAIADPAHAPAGLYAAEALKSLGLWDALDGRLSYCTDVRAALTQVRAQAVHPAGTRRTPQIECDAR